MAIGIGMKFPEGNQEQYDAIFERLGIRDDPPEGLVFHCAGPLDEGWSVIDVWESREDFDRFAEEKLRSAAEEEGVDFNQGELTEFAVHNVLKA
jgi:hypothetical protein